ncbi:MAG TPA: DUF4215 domain-containing protein [Nannocystaceae bacterium]|nr:DUF4215 domain-containing protein [Nannocystaceae bacterium]
MSHPRSIVPLTLTTLLACTGDPIADPSATAADTGTTSDTTSTSTIEPTSGSPTSTGASTTGEPTTGGTTGDETTGSPDSFCGDSHVDAGEECDNGAANGNDQACTDECMINVCGDGMQGPGEGCDDGNVVDGDECSSVCSLPDCGDGFVGGGEACDDGNADDTDACTSACTVATCGDGFPQPVNGEECDDGAFNNVAAICTPDCLNAACGDGYVFVDQEECDDGNLVDGDGCSAACVAPPNATTLKLDFSQVKRFDFSWAAANGATFYRLLERPTPSDPFTQVGGDILEEKLSWTMPLHLRYGARYVLEACNDGGCTASPPLDVVNHMATAIGYFKASNTEANDTFGRIALSADGKTLAVGASGEDSAATGIDGSQADNTASGAGAVYVFTEVDGVWSQQAYIKASNTEAGDAFGVAVALSADGNVLAVGANGEDSAATGVDGDQADNAASGSGAVYVFGRTGQTWSQQHYIKASNCGAADGFGGRIALASDGDTLAVAATGEDSSASGVDGNQADNSSSGAGAVYVFVRAQGSWSQKAYVKASNPEAGDAFGWSLSLSADGKTLAASALNEDSAATGIDGDQASNAASNAGAAYVFRAVGGVWSQQAYVKASNTEANDAYGQSLALSADGDTLAVGAIGEDSSAGGINGDQGSNATLSAGAVYVYAYAADAWSQQAYVKASNPLTCRSLGAPVTLSPDGNTLAVVSTFEPSGAIGVGGNQFNDVVMVSGAVYLYERVKSEWSQRAYIKAPNPDVLDQFGTSGLQISADGRILAVGTNAEDSAATGIGGKQADNTASGAGAVYLY